MKNCAIKYFICVQSYFQLCRTTCPFHKARLVCARCGFIPQVWEFVGIRFPLKFSVVVCKNARRKCSFTVCSYSTSLRSTLQFLPRFLQSKRKSCLLLVALSMSTCFLSLYMLRAFLSLGLGTAVRYSANLYSLCRLSLKPMRDLQCGEQTQQSGTFNLCVLV